MGVLRSGVLIGAVVFHNYHPEHGTIEMSSTGEHHLSRSILNQIFGYVFDEIACQAVIMRVDPENSRMCRIAQAFGFDRYDIPRLRGRNKSEAIFILPEEKWQCSRFNMRGSHGQKSTKGT